MEKPRNYDNTQTYGEYEPLPPGAYECVVIDVKETKSKNGKDMLNIYLDIARGEYRDFFNKQYASDTRPEKKWPCIVYQLLLDNEGNCNKGLKTFISALKGSSPDFDENKVWGTQTSAYLRGKGVGGVFRREQYRKDGNLRWSTKCMRFCSLSSVEDTPVPEDKLIEETTFQPTGGSWGDYDSNGRLPWDE